MKNNFLVVLLMLFSSSNNFAQKKVISGKIIDIISSKGIANVHIYSTNLGEGTITNADGNFYLIVTNSDDLQISCIGYDKQIIKVLTKDIRNLVIEMKPKTELLDEVVINTKTLSVDEILTKTFKNFKKNHSVEPVYYNFYNRIVNYVDKDSTLISLQEYSGKIKQGKSHFSKYNIDKARVKFFGKDAKKLSKEHRLISMTKMYIDNIYKYREDYLKNKGKRIYEYKLLKRSAILGRDCYVIYFNTDKENYDQKGEIYIDMEDFSIVRKVTRKLDNRIYKDITFKKEKDKWYLKKSEEFHGLYGATIPNTNYRITLYNYIDIEDSDLEFINLNVQNSTKITSDFSDDFWENTNFIPLPNWVKSQMK
jgi:hypothetical protein